MNLHDILNSMRWDVDNLVYLGDMEDYYWLKANFLKGKRNGITSCCQYNYECGRHKELREKLEKQKVNEN